MLESVPCITTWVEKPKSTDLRVQLGNLEAKWERNCSLLMLGGSSKRVFP